MFCELCFSFVLNLLQYRPTVSDGIQGVRTGSREPVLGMSE